MTPTQLRHFYRCRQCLAIAVRETTSPDRPRDEPACDCGGHLDYLGRVKGLSLWQQKTACACDARCTYALGPQCDCSCGGRNHGTHAVVTFDAGVGPVPKVRPRADLQTRLALVAEYRAAIEAARARADAATRGEFARYRQGAYIANRATWDKCRAMQDAIHHAAGLKTHKGRMAALAKVAAPEKVAS
jgi:hypothetical protein